MVVAVAGEVDDNRLLSPLGRTSPQAYTVVELCPDGFRLRGETSAQTGEKPAGSLNEPMCSALLEAPRMLLLLPVLPQAPLIV